jgi:ADP-ribosylation factor GTPase-activating protein 1
MKVGGNQLAREFFESRDDYDDSMPIQQKYNTKAAVLYRDKIATLAQGKEWDIKKAVVNIENSQKSSNISGHSAYLPHSKSAGALSSYQNAGSYQDSNSSFDMEAIKDQKEQFFNRKQNENAMKPE